MSELIELAKQLNELHGQFKKKVTKELRAKIIETKADFKETSQKMIDEIKTGIESLKAEIADNKDLQPESDKILNETLDKVEEIESNIKI